MPCPLRSTSTPCATRWRRRGRWSRASPASSSRASRRRCWSPFSGDAATSFYDTAPLQQTLERLVDFDRLNSGEVRVSVGAVNVRTGNLTYFDTAERRLGPKHFMASGALPPGFPAVEIEGEHYWDGGVVSNTPLSRVLSGEPRDTLTFQIDLWSARGRVPHDLMEVSSRQKDIQYSSRTRAITDHMTADAEDAPGVAADDGEVAGERKGRIRKSAPSRIWPAIAPTTSST